MIRGFSLPLLLAAIVCEIAFALIAFRSSYFEYGSRSEDRPLLEVLAYFAVAFAGYFFACWFVASRQKTAPDTSDRSNKSDKSGPAQSETVQSGSGLRRYDWAIIVTATLVFRLTFAFTPPIQEIDLYRYIWDGNVLAQGYSPFQNSPLEIRAAIEHQQGTPEQLALAEVCSQRPGLQQALYRIHYPQYTTVYPPVSQVVFAVSAALTPRSASVDGHRLMMKAVILFFDLAIFVTVALLLRGCQRLPHLALAYGWCPLVLKEFANSGHLDSIAVAFMLLAALLIVCHTSLRSTLGGCLCLGLAVGAKLFPIILVPLVVAWIWKRDGWRRLLMAGSVFLLTLLAAVGPMFWPQTTVDSTTPVNSATQEKSAGLNAFVQHWEMNDWLFLIVFENVRPQSPLPAERAEPHSVPWFSIVPHNWRTGLLQRINPDPQQWRSTAFTLTRASLLVLFLCLVAKWSWEILRREDASRQHALSLWLLTLAWFWLVSPTQNPWYWTWVIPFLPFQRRLPYWGMSALCMIYYLRFWLLYNYSDTMLVGTRYTGTTFFDLVVTWLEFAPWFVWLAVDWFWQRTQHKASIRHDHASLTGES